MAKELGLRYAITQLSDGNPVCAQVSDGPEQRRMRLQAQVRRCLVDGVEFLQLREKGMEGSELLALARTATEALRGTATRLLVNGRADLAAVAGAHGVHLTAAADELRPEQVRQVFRAAGWTECFVSVSCHSADEVRRAHGEGADLALFGPVFEKRVGGEVVVAGLGLASLHEACAAAGEMPVLALGGVSAANAKACRDAGAAGVAGIRLFA